MSNPGISLTPEVSEALKHGAAVAIGISGGKDSDAMAIALNKYLDEIGHPRDRRVLIHADLGLIEWPETMEWVQKLADHVGLDLMIVRRQAGDMIQRWEGRWAANLRRYENLECVTLITPWSTPAMRFCTSELKVSPICSALKKRWPTGIILSASGIRAEESPNRAKAPIAKEQAKLKRRGQVGFDWHPILSWKLTDVLALHEAENFPLHPAYTQFGSSRLSCAFCMLARMEDHLAALKQKGNHPSYHRLVALEVASGFSFQQNRWLGDRMPELLAEDTLNQIQLSKEKGRLRREAESAIPKSVLFVKGWPHAMPTVEEAQLLADARTKVCALIGIENRFPTVKSVQDRYGELLREAGKDQSCLPGLAEEESGGDLVLCA